MALVNPNIAMSYRGVELPQQNALADYAAVQQIQSGQRQAEVSQMQIEQMRRDQAALSKMQAAITAKGGPSDLNVAAEEMINSGIPEYFKQGLVIKQTLDKQSRFASLLGPSGGAAPTTAPPSEAYPGYNESIGMRAPTNALAPASEAYPGYNEAIGMTNALAPAPAAAPSNAMNLSDMRNRINQAYSIGTPEALAWAKAREEELKPMTVSPGATVFQGGQSVFTAPATPAAPAAPPSMVAEYTFAKTKDGGNFKGSYQDFVTARAAAGRAPAAPRVEPAPTVTTVEDPNNPGKFLQVDARQYRGGGAGAPGVIGGARPSALSEKTATQKVQLGKDINQAIFELKNAAKTGGLIDKSTGSGAGRLYDIGAGFFGSAPEGAIATGQLAPIADLVLKMVPRFEGPQSDKDTQSYKAAAGQLADSSLPTKIRKAAANEIIRLMEARKNQFGSADMAAPAGGGVDTDNPLLK